MMKTVKMTQAEINEKIAGLRGYKRLTKREQQSTFAANGYGTWKSPEGGATVLPKWTTSLDAAYELVAEMLETRDVILRIADWVDEKTRCCELKDDEFFDCGDICVSICAAYIYFKTGKYIEYSP